MLAVIALRFELVPPKIEIYLINQSLILNGAHLRLLFCFSYSLEQVAIGAYTIDTLQFSLLNLKMGCLFTTGII